jgi:hypothetical protein
MGFSIKLLVDFIKEFLSCFPAEDHFRLQIFENFDLFICATRIIYD